jgi:hypothetical protein
MVFRPNRYIDLSVKELCVSVAMDDDLNIYIFARTISGTRTSNKITLINFKL